MAQRPDNFKGIDLTSPVNRIPAGRVAIAQNVRAYTEGGFALRTGLSSPIIMVDSSISSVVRMNDTTPTGPRRRLLLRHRHRLWFGLRLPGGRPESGCRRVDRRPGIADSVSPKHQREAVGLHRRQFDGRRFEHKVCAERLVGNVCVFREHQGAL